MTEPDGGPSPAVRLRDARWAMVGGAVVWLVLSLRVLMFGLGPEDRIVSVIPDDAFYYFQLARNFTRHGTWTFDGVDPTTGFHPLYAYLLAALHETAGDLDARALLLVVGLVSSVALATAAFLTGATVTRLVGREAVPLVVAVFLTPVAVVQSTMLMETWLVCLVSAAVVLRVSSPMPHGRWGAAGLVVLGSLGSLSRTDFLVLPLGLVLGHVVTVRSSPWSAGLRRSAWVLAGAFVGLTLVALQDWGVSGSLLQSSVTVKSHWADTLDAHADPLVRVLTQFWVLAGLATSTLVPSLPFRDLGLLGTYLAMVGLLALVAAAIRSLRRRGPASTSDGRLPLILGSLLGIGGYLAVYSRDWVSVQIWYSANLLVPSALVLAIVGSTLLGARLLVPAIAMAVAYVALSLTMIDRTLYPNQVSPMLAGMALRHTPLDGPVGSWNAGVLGFYADHGVVNLDGLVNDEAVPYIVDGNLDGYLRARGIRYIVDYQAMLDDPTFRSRGGYQGPELDRCLLPATDLVRTSVRWHATELRMWEIKPACLQP